MEASVLANPSADFASNYNLDGTECTPMDGAHHYSGHFLCQSSDKGLCSCSEHMTENKELCEMLYHDEALQAVAEKMVSDGLLCDESKPLYGMLYNDEAIEAGATKTEGSISDGLLCNERKALCELLNNDEAINPIARKMEESISDVFFCNANKALSGTLHDDEAVNSAELSTLDDLCNENEELCEMLYNDEAINAVAGNGLFCEEFSKRLAQKMAVDISDGPLCNDVKKQLAREMEFSISAGLFCNEANEIPAGDMEADFSDDSPLHNEVGVSFSVLHNDANERLEEEMEHAFFDSPLCNKGNGSCDAKVCILEDLLCNEQCQHRRNFLVEAVLSQDDLSRSMSTVKLHRDTKWCDYNEANKKGADIKLSPDNNNAERKLNCNVEADILLCDKADEKLAKVGKADNLKDTLCQMHDTELLSMCKRVTENNAVYKKHYREVNKRIKKKLEIHVPENLPCNPAKKSLTCKESSEILYKQASGSLLSLKQSIRNGAKKFNAIEKRSVKKENVGMSEDVSCKGFVRKLEKCSELTMKCKTHNNEGKKRLAKEMEPDNLEDIRCNSSDKKVRRSLERQPQNKILCKKPHKEAKMVSLRKVENISNNPILKRLEGNPLRYQEQVIQRKAFVEKPKKIRKDMLAW